jgi:hypothetical protein
MGALYRCHICRLELVLDPDTRKLTVAPIRTTEPVSPTAPTVPPKKSRRRLT